MAQKAKTVADVIAGALKVFGPNGENWNNHSIHSVTFEGRDTYCALGAINKAASGRANYCSSGVAREAADLVASCVPTEYMRYSQTSAYIPGWNDNLSSVNGFRSIKSVFCKALKKAIAQEQPASKRKAVVKKRSKKRVVA